MATLPKNSIPSMASYMAAANGVEAEEKALLVRIGSLIDALVERERGKSNVGAQRKSTLNTSLKTPTGTAVESIQSAQIEITPVGDTKNLEHYEIEYDTDPNFSNPTKRTTFGTEINVKDLVSNTSYNFRIRAAVKNGFMTAWENLGSIAISGSVVQSDFTAGTHFVAGSETGEEAVSDTFTASPISKEIFCMSGYSSFNFIMGDAFSNVTTATMTLTRTVDATDTQIEDIELENFDKLETDITFPPRDDTESMANQRLNYPVIFSIDDQTPIGEVIFKVELEDFDASTGNNDESTIWILF